MILKSLFPGLIRGSKNKVSDKIVLQQKHAEKLWRCDV